MNDTIVPHIKHASRNEQPQRLNAIDRLAKKVVLGQLNKLQTGSIELIDGSERRSLGTGAKAATVRVRSPRFYRRLMLNGSLGAADGYINHDWTTDNLTQMLRLFVRNIEVAHGMQRGWAGVAKQLARGAHWMRRNTQAGSRRNIRAHYDIGNDLFELFLDDTMTYSSGYFATPHTPLRDASIAKLDRLCRKLDLKPSDHLLEIGTGWGSMAIHAAKQFGCKVTTTTISDEQYALAKSRLEAAGLADRITLLKADYRNLREQFDKVVSIEMIEAVGHDNLKTYFNCCSNLLKPDGAMALQGITMNERAYPAYLKSADFIQRYVFPGSCCPALSAMTSAIGSATDMRIVDVEDIGLHYARTLAIWRDNFFNNIHDVRAAGYTDAFIRLWDYYLSYCEAGFAERYIGNAQMVMIKPGCRLTPMRNIPAPDEVA